ncbi:MAG TPA: efflux RND transporter periplasmic adaptor subunit [Stellaceae bacterium]
MKTAGIGFRQRRLAVPLLMLVLTAAGGSALLRNGNGQTPPQPAATAASGIFKPTDEQWNALQIETVGTRSFRTERVTEGNIALDDDLNTPVFSPYSGRVTRLTAKLGDKVERGAPLFAVEATEFVQAANDLIAAALAQRTARVQLTQAEINEKRAHELYNAKGGALKDWQQTQTDLAAAQNTLRTAEMALAAVRNRLRILGKSDKEIAALETQQTQKLEPGTVVTAPITGMVTQRQVGLGQYIPSVTSGASNPVYTIGDLSMVWLIANVREADAGAVRVGQPVEVHVLALPDRIFKAQISWVAPSVDPNTHRLPVRANVENPDGLLKPNMFAMFSIITGDAVTAPAVPQSAIVYEGDKARVWVASEDRSLSLREVQVGRSSEGLVEIRSGLSAGEKLVTRGTIFIDRAGGIS